MATMPQCRKTITQPAEQLPRLEQFGAQRVPHIEVDRPPIARRPVCLDVPRQQPCGQH